MNTILVIIGVIAVLGVIYYIVWKKGHINDRDKDLIPDEVEDAVADVKKVAKEVKRRGKNVKKELKDVVKAAKEVGNQLGDVGAAITGKKRQGRKKKK
jgi:F0F1-type ATP synthase membrane subunit b/b'